MTKESYAMARGRSIALATPALLAVVVAAWLGACGGRAAVVAEPAAATVRLVEAAEAAEKERRYDDARGLYERAVAEAPDDRSAAYASRALASALLFWGDEAGATDALEAAVRLDPELTSAWHDLGILRARGGDVAGAEAALRRSIQIEPADPRSRIAVAALLVRERRFAEARVDYQALLELDLDERLREAVHRALELLAAEPDTAPRDGLHK